MSLIIRSDQLEALEEVSLPPFEDFMVEHIKQFSPLHSASLGESGIRTLIRAGVQRAARHGMTRRGPKQFYVETTILLGIDFDTDPQYPSVAQILARRSVGDQVQRADAVHAWLMQYLEAAGGPERQYARRALERARQLPLQSGPTSSPTFEAEMLQRMRDTHPEKVACLGEEALRGLLPRAVAEARRYGVATDTGISLLIALMFAVGHGVVNDPKYPWVSNTLTNPAIADANKRVERLYSKTMTYLDQVLQALGTG